jgi:hypothetical protein
MQRWGIFWWPLRLSMHHRGVAIRVACRLHNICTDGTAVTCGYSSDLKSGHHRDMWTDEIRQAGLTWPAYSKYSKATVRK